MKKIVLLCAGGMSTSLMVTKMKDYADSIGFECEITAYAVNTAAKNAKDADMILLWPQGRFRMDDIKVQCPGVPVEAMDMMDYGMMKGEKVMKHVLELIGK